MHKLGVIVPFRNRDKQLWLFLRRVPKYLEKQGIKFEIIVSEQMDEEDFNRGALLNAGVLEAEALGCDYVAFHDVDLLPRYVDYSYSDVPLELVGKIIDDSYEEAFQVNLEEIADNYFGGVVIFPINLLRKVNGYSNRYIGWGFEDDDLLKRCEECQVPVDIKNYRQVPNLEPALTFDGKESYAEMLIGKLNLTQPLSFLVTFRVQDCKMDKYSIGDEYCIFSIPGRDLALSYTNYGTYKFEVFDNYGEVYSIHTKKLPIGLACQAVINIDPSKKLIEFYLNGVLVGRKHWVEGHTLKVFSEKVYLGVGDPDRKEHNKYFTGQISDFAIFTRKILTQPEIVKLFNESYLGLGPLEPTYWMTAKILNGDILVPTCGTKQCFASAYKCTTEPMVSLQANYGITIPLKRPGTFTCQRHLKNGGTLGYWKSWAVRLNQERFYQAASLGTHRQSDGLSTICTIARIQSDKERDYHHVRVYFLSALPKLK